VNKLLSRALKGTSAIQLIEEYEGLITPSSIWRLLAELQWQARVIGHQPTRSMNVQLRSDPSLKIWVHPFADMGIVAEIFGEEVYGAIPKYLKRCETVVDLGCNIGLASLYFARQYPGCRIVCVEPLDRNYSLILKNLAAPIAAGSCIPFHAAYSLDDSPVEGTFTFGGEGQRMSAVGMSMASLCLAGKFDEVDLVKVDIEGGEVGLFQETGWLERTRAIAIEFHGDSRLTTDFDATIRQQGMRIVDESAHTVLAIRE
jgi:FkbM family methyltransferase